MLTIELHEFLSRNTGRLLLLVIVRIVARLISSLGCCLRLNLLPNEVSEPKASLSAASSHFVVDTETYSS